MIVFKTLNGYEWDFSNLGLTFNETSPFFDSETSSGYTFPVNTIIDRDFAQKFGLINEDNIKDYKVNIEGYLIVDDDFYNARLSISNIKGLSAKISLTYGKEVLAVFNKKIKDLAWPLIDTNGDWSAHIASISNLEFPQASHQFPIVYRPQIKEKSNYNLFEGFVNNRNVNGDVLVNQTLFLNQETTHRNANVIAPMPYLLEVLRMGFADAGLQLRGEVVNDEFVKKLLWIPDKFFEYYSDPAQRQVFKFGFKFNRTIEDGISTDIFKKDIIPQKNGLYTLESIIKLPEALSSRASLKITYGSKVILDVFSEGRAFNVDQKSLIFVSNDDFSTINVTLKIPATNFSLADYTTFYFDYSDGKRNEFPERYSLSEILPDMTFREYFDKVKKWLNIEPTYYENAVYLNFMDNTIQNLEYIDHSHLQVEPSRVLNKNGLFRLKYADGQELLVDKTGQVFSDEDYLESQTNEIEFDVLPVQMVEVDGRITAEWPEQDADLVVGIYVSSPENETFLVSEFEDKNLSLQNLYENNHRYFLRFRANAETYQETYQASADETFSLKSGVYKHNKKMLFTTLKRKRISEKVWQVTSEAESF